MKKKYINRLKRITKHVGEWSYPPKHDRERGKKAWQLNPAENQSRGNSPKNTQSVTQKRREDTILSHNNCLKSAMVLNNSSHVHYTTAWWYKITKSYTFSSSQIHKRYQHKIHYQRLKLASNLDFKEIHHWRWSKCWRISLTELCAHFLLTEIWAGLDLGYQCWHISI